MYRRDCDVELLFSKIYQSTISAHLKIMFEITLYYGGDFQKKEVFFFSPFVIKNAQTYGIIHSQKYQMGKIYVI